MQLFAKIGIVSLLSIASISSYVTEAATLPNPCELNISGTGPTKLSLWKPSSWNALDNRSQVAPTLRYYLSADLTANCTQTEIEIKDAFEFLSTLIHKRQHLTPLEAESIVLRLAWRPALRAHRLWIRRWFKDYSTPGLQSRMIEFLRAQPAESLAKGEGAFLLAQLVELTQTQVLEVGTVEYFNALPLATRMQVVRIAQFDYEDPETLAFAPSLKSFWERHALTTELEKFRGQHLARINELTHGKVDFFSSYTTFELGLGGRFGYSNEGIRIRLIGEELADTTAYGLSAVQLLHQLSKHRLEAALTTEDAGAGKRKVALLRPATFLIAIVLDCLSRRPTPLTNHDINEIWTWAKRLSPSVREHMLNYFPELEPILAHPLTERIIPALQRPLIVWQNVLPMLRLPPLTKLQ